MNPSNKETETKLPIADLEQAIRALQQINAQVVQERYLEDNFLYDQPDDVLAKERKLLRIRVMASVDPPHEKIKTLLTYKGPPVTIEGAKEREELECRLQNGDQFLEILLRLGFRVTFRYQKFRAIYRPPDLELDICIDETPIGNFFELEGEILRIHEIATKLGYNRDDYISQSYATLYYRWCQKTGSQEPFMLFQSESPQRRGDAEFR